MRLGRTINVRMKVTSNESQIFNSLVLNKQQRPRTILGSNSPNRLLAGFLATSACRWLARRLTSLFLAHVRGLPGGSPDGSLIGLLPHSFRSSVARRTDRSSAYLLVPSARQWLARRIAHRLTCLFLPLISGSPDGSLVGLLAHSFRASVACPARGIDRSSAYFLVSSAHQWLARLAGRSAHRLSSSFLPLVSSLPGSPEESLIGLLPHSFRSSVARRTDRSLAYILVSSAHQWLARWLTRRITHWLTSSFLALVSGLPGSPDGSLIGYLGRLSRAVFFTVHHDVHEA